MRIGLDWDDTVADTETLIKNHFKDKYNVPVTARTNFNFSSMIHGITDDRIGEIIWQSDRKEIFYSGKMQFVDGAIDFIRWCKDNRHEVTIVTATPEHDYVYDGLNKLPLDLLGYIDNKVVFTWCKHLVPVELFVDDDERFIEKCWQANKVAILLKKPQYQYKQSYRWEANTFEEVKRLINILAQ